MCEKVSSLEDFEDLIKKMYTSSTTIFIKDFEKKVEKKIERVSPARPEVLQGISNTFVSEYIGPLMKALSIALFADDRGRKNDIISRLPEPIRTIFSEMLEDMEKMIPVNEAKKILTSQNY